MPQTYPFSRQNFPKCQERRPLPKFRVQHRCSRLPLPLPSPTVSSSSPLAPSLLVAPLPLSSLTPALRPLPLPSPALLVPLLLSSYLANTAPRQRRHDSIRERKRREKGGVRGLPPGRSGSTGDAGRFPRPDQAVAATSRGGFDGDDGAGGFPRTDPPVVTASCGGLTATTAAAASRNRSVLEALRTFLYIRKMKQINQFIKRT